MPSMSVVTLWIGSLSIAVTGGGDCSKFPSVVRICTVTPISASASILIPVSEPVCVRFGFANSPSVYSRSVIFALQQKRPFKRKYDC